MTKRILCVYVTKEDKQIFEHLGMALDNYIIDNTDCEEETKSFLEKYYYEFIVVDFTDERGRKILDYIYNKNNFQKVITVSSDFEGSEYLGCDFCAEHYRRRRIFKPLNVKELINVMQSFDKEQCYYMNKFKDTIVFLNKISSRFNCYTFNERDNSISPKTGMSESMVLEEILEITNLLSKSNIKYRVDEKYNINIAFN